MNRQTVLVQGTFSSDAEEVWIKVNGVLAEIYNDQFVANNVPSTDGENRIIANALDSNGGVGRVKDRVSADTMAPHITLHANISRTVTTVTT